MLNGFSIYFLTVAGMNIAVCLMPVISLALIIIMMSYICI